MLRSRSRHERMDQASRLRALAGGARRTALTVAIASGKGGVGKTNVAVNLAICLSAKGLRVTLIDMDMGLANADVLLGIQARYTLSHVLTGLRSIEEVVLDAPGGVRFIPGASGLQSVANLSDFERHNLMAQLERLGTSSDIVVMDCGAGISRNVIGFARMADRVVVVTTPEPTAVTDAYATIKVLLRGGFSGEASLLVNMAGSQAEARSVYHRLSEVAKRFLKYSVADLGYILHDTCVESAVRERCPFVIRSPSSNASACIAAVAEKLAERSSAPQGRGGLFKRVVGLFA